MSDIQVADIAEDGALSAWRTLSQTLPGGVPREGLTAAAYNGFLYVMGGANSGYLSDVYYAPIQADGSLGGWTSARSFVTPRWYHGSAAYGGYLCVMGGEGSAGLLNDCQCAPIRGDGSLGTWIQGASFGTARRHHAAAVSDGNLFVLGGWGGSQLADVQVASLKTQAARAAYSKRLDFGSEQLFQMFTFANSGASPRSTFNLRCDLQNSTGGPVHRLSFPDSLPEVAQWVSSCSRYFRFRIDFDDRQCVTMGGPAGDVQSLSLLAIPMAMGDTLGVTKTGPVHLTWGSSWAPYEVRRCDSTSGPCAPMAIATTSGTSYDDPVLGDGASYWYEVETLCPSF